MGIFGIKYVQKREQNRWSSKQTNVVNSADEYRAKKVREARRQLNLLSSQMLGPEKEVKVQEQSVVVSEPINTKLSAEVSKKNPHCLNDIFFDLVLEDRRNWLNIR